MLRRFALSAAALLAACLVLAPAARAQQKVGVLMLHGKNPGDNRGPIFRPLKAVFEREGWTVHFPSMPWGANRYLSGNWDQAMAEIEAQVKDLRAGGATRIVLVGHSMGAPAALSFAARGGDVQALVLLAPGHNPLGYYNASVNTSVRESIDQARAMVAAGNGAQKARFNDSNQGRNLSMSTTAADYLSFFDPESDAAMHKTAPRVPATVAVFTAIGQSDPLFMHVRALYVDRLPANPAHRFLEVKGGHLDTPEVAKDEVVRWIREVAGS